VVLVLAVELEAFSAVGKKDFVKQTKSSKRLEGAVNGSEADIRKASVDKVSDLPGAERPSGC